MKTLLDYDPESGVQTWHSYDEMSDTTYIEEVQDIAPIIANNYAIQRAEPESGGRLNWVDRAGLKSGFNHIAQIPNVIITKWRKEYGINIFLWGKCDWTTRKMKQLLNSEEWRHLRTGTGRI